VFQSPTGTGKSISIIGSTLTWYKKNWDNGNIIPTQETDSQDDEPQWIKDFDQKRNKELKLNIVKQLQEKRSLLKQHINQANQATDQAIDVPSNKKIKLSANDPDDELILQDTNNDAIEFLMQFIDSDEPEIKHTRIIYASRTVPFVG
jgi:mevalonate kinase